jgi:hypothetical protein
MASRDPHRLQTENFRAFLDKKGDISDRVLKILAYMDSLQMNLPLLLWAVSWNVPDLVANPRVRFARMALMVSNELTQILSHWFFPPRAHGQGIRTKAARKVMSEWAVTSVCKAIDSDLCALKGLLSLPNEDMSEETLLAISFKELVPQVQALAPTLWRVFLYATSTKKQDKNKLKDPGSVCRPIFILCVLITVIVYRQY